MCNKTPDQALAAFCINFHFVAVQSHFSNVKMRWEASNMSPCLALNALKALSDHTHTLNIHQNYAGNHSIVQESKNVPMYLRKKKRCIIYLYEQLHFSNVPKKKKGALHIYMNSCICPCVELSESFTHTHLAVLIEQTNYTSHKTPIKNNAHSLPRVCSWIDENHVHTALRRDK